MKKEGDFPLFFLLSHISLHEDVYKRQGKSIAYIDEKVLFVPNTLPGDIVDVQVTRKRKNFMEGIVTHTHRFSALRIAPACTHFGICGGCKLSLIHI